MSAEKSFRRKNFPPNFFSPKKIFRGKKNPPEKKFRRKKIFRRKFFRREKFFRRKNPTRKKSRSGVEDEKHRDTRARHSSNVVSSAPPPRTGKKKIKKSD